jgi:hypothetical protein
LDLGKIPLLQILAKIKAGGEISGRVSGSVDVRNLGTLAADGSLSIKDLKIDQQTLTGAMVPLNIPQIFVSTGEIEAKGKNGKLELKTLTLGKAGNAKDDLVYSATGDVTFVAAGIGGTQLNLKNQLKANEKVAKAFLLDILLGSSKTGEGTYAFALSGPVYNLAPTPIK